MTAFSTDKLHAFRQQMATGEEIPGGSPLHETFHQLAQRALKLTADINSRYYSPQELHQKIEELTMSSIGEGFALFVPFYTNCGVNISLGKNVFINSGCHFQDQGGITIEDNVLIGHNVVITTLNHNQDPLRRANLLPAPVHIGPHVWIGANVTICPGVTVGEGAILAAGAVVNKDVPPRTVVGGVPADILKQL